MIKQAKRRQYNNDYPSVTQVLDVLRKIGLEMWFKQNTLEFINRESSKGKLIGTQIHEAIQSNIELSQANIETEYPDEVMTALKSFMLFRKEHPDVYLYKSELMLTSEIYKYNGTLDAIGEVNGETVIFDWKTSKCGDKEIPDIYDEYIYQVSAYTKAYNEINSTNIKRALIVSIAKDKVAYNLKEIREEEINESFNEVFLSALKIWYYKKNGGKQNGLFNEYVGRKAATNVA